MLFCFLMSGATASAGQSVEIKTAELLRLASEAPVPVLGGVVLGPAGGFAVLDGGFYAIGDKVGLYVVKGIDERTVTLEGGSGRDVVIEFPRRPR